MPVMPDMPDQLDMPVMLFTPVMIPTDFEQALDKIVITFCSICSCNASLVPTLLLYTVYSSVRHV